MVTHGVQTITVLAAFLRSRLSRTSFTARAAHFLLLYSLNRTTLSPIARPNSSSMSRIPQNWTGVFRRLTFPSSQRPQCVSRTLQWCACLHNAFLSRSLLWTVATGLRNQNVAVPYVGNEPYPRFPRRSICALGWSAREAARPITNVFGHLIDQRGRMRSGGTRTRQTGNRCTRR